jgi:hypothetical protein
MIHVQQPYKKKVKLGDVFALRFDDRFVFGQVVAQDVKFGGFASCQHKVAIFRQFSQSVTGWNDCIASGLLIPPQYINNLGFSRGFMPVVGMAAPVTLNEKEYCYKDSRGRVLDEQGNPCEARNLVSDYGFGNYLTLEYQIESRF